jgi:hypothetical protein
MHIKKVKTNVLVPMKGSIFCYTLLGCTWLLQFNWSCPFTLHEGLRIIGTLFLRIRRGYQSCPQNYLFPPHNSVSMIVKDHRNLLNFVILRLHIQNFRQCLLNLSIRFHCFQTQPKGKIQNTVLSHCATIKKLKPGGKFDDPHCLT